MTVEDLARRLSEHEFRHWQIYANKKLLPGRRISMQLALLTKWVAGSMGGFQGDLEDFLFDRVEEREATVDEELAFFQFKPYKKKNLPSE